MRNLEYSKKTEYRNNSVMSIYVDGNAARKIEEEPPVKKKKISDEEMRERQRRKKEALAKAQRRSRIFSLAIKSAAIIGAAAVIMLLVITALNGTVRTNELTTQINSLESEYETLVSQNDSKEYDIDRSVDLNKIIKTATEEYGMVRGSTDQIITYKADNDSEYIQQMAEIPD